MEDYKMLTVANLSKFYNKNMAVKDLNFQVSDGEIIVLLGPNGAGKSTTIKCIAGLLQYEGEIKIDNHLNKSLKAKKSFSYIPELPSLYELLTVEEHLEFIARTYSVKDYKTKMQDLLERFDLTDKINKLGKELSKGMQQKVSICCGLITNPKVILFDEPMIGLDPKAIKELKNILVELKKCGCSIIISTHIIDSIDELWDKVLIMKNGEAILQKTKCQLINTDESLEDIFFKVTEG
jgi:ABC-2 type transport system ATP-binding protein